MRGLWRENGCGRLGRRLLGRRSGLGEACWRWTFCVIVGRELRCCFVGYDGGVVKLVVMAWVLGTMSVLSGGDVC